MNGYKIEITLAPEVSTKKVKELLDEHNCQGTFLGSMEQTVAHVVTDDPINFFRLGRCWLAGLGDHGHIIQAR